MRYPINACRESFEAEYAKSRDVIDDLGSQGKWEHLLKLLHEDESEVNSTRLPSKECPSASLMTPLHYAANNKAPKDVFEELLAMGASKTLRTAKNETAFDIGKVNGLEQDVLELLQIPHSLLDNGSQISKMEEALHDVILSRADELVSSSNVALPQLSYFYEKGGFYFPVPGMYGGFAVKSHEEGLEVNSENMGGSEMTHFINRNGEVTMK